MTKQERKEMQKVANYMRNNPDRTIGDSCYIALNPGDSWPEWADSMTELSYETPFNGHEKESLTFLSLLLSELTLNDQTRTKRN